MKQIQQSIVRNRLLQLLSAEDFAQLSLELVNLPVKLVLVEPNIPIDFLYFMEDGMTSVTTHSLAGEVEVGMIGREGLVAALPILLGVDRSPYTHFVQMPGSGFRVSTKNILDCFERSSALRRLLMRSIQALTVQIAQTAFSNALYTIEVRLARWLLMCRDRSASDEMILTHEFLAQMLGVRRPGVSVATQMLEGNRLIKAERGRITILDRVGLEAVANESYGLPEAVYADLMQGQ